MIENDHHEDRRLDGASACINSDSMLNVSCCTDTSLKWRRPPRKVLLIKKRDSSDDHVLTSHLVDIAKYLVSEFNISPLIEPGEEVPGIEAIKEELLPLACTHVDFVVCLGGDGSLMHVNSLFKGRVPPVIGFFCGTLGFLTPFHIDNFKEEISKIVKGEAQLTLRSRLYCKLYRQPRPKDGREDPGSCLSDREEFHVLNEMVVDRGPSPYVTDVLCSCNDKQITTIRADGIIISTPTGSTAYSLSAGASMVHPLVPCILFTPICPHSLSFRPVIFPDSVQLKLEIPKTARNPAWVSFDGRFRKRLDPGEYVTVQTSPWVFPSITKTAVVNEWFTDIAKILHWNDKPSH